jgi:hypothetical protein
MFIRDFDPATSGSFRILVYKNDSGQDSKRGQEKGQEVK